MWIAELVTVSRGRGGTLIFAQFEYDSRTRPAPVSQKMLNLYTHNPKTRNMSTKKEYKSSEETRRQVINAERSFAKSMADRDLEAFKHWLSEEAIFFGTDPPLRGKQAIVDHWSRFYESDEAPFSWNPDTVEVLSSSKLALSSGPVLDSKGNLTGLFNSIWRMESPGTWRVIFDKGSPAPQKKSE